LRRRKSQGALRGAEQRLQSRGVAPAGGQLALEFRECAIGGTA
jgi:hypothetical protein